MELTKRDTSMIKGLAMIFLLWLHLFNTKDYQGLFQPIIFMGRDPLVYQLSLVAGSCVSIYLFCSGYGLTQSNKVCFKDNIKRILKLLLNYWVILLLFVGIGMLLDDPRYPGSLKEFLLNFFLLSKSYNGAWWFLQSYVLLVLLSPIIIRLVKNNNSILIVLVSGIVYFVSFLLGIKDFISINNEAILIIYNLVKNFGLCVFSFILGVVFVKESIISKIYSIFKNNALRKVTGYLGMIVILLINIIVENFVIDPITAVCVIILFKFIEPKKLAGELLVYLSKHSTNIWLTHMFFYMIFFKSLVFSLTYPMLILLGLLIMCIVTSYFINFIYYRILSAIEEFIGNENVISVNKDMS